MQSNIQLKSIRWAGHIPAAAVDDQRSSANAAVPAIASGSSRAQSETHGTQGTEGYIAPGSSSIDEYHSDVYTEGFECAGPNRANNLPEAASLSGYTPTASSTAPSTDVRANSHTYTTSTSPSASSSRDLILAAVSDIVETGSTSDQSSTMQLIEICQGTFVAVTQEPSNEDKLQWRALSKRIHMAFAKTCRRYPNLSVQFKLAGASADCLHPVVLFVCPPKTQKQVRKFLKKQNWLSEAECGYKNMVVDGTFLRVVLDGEGGLDGGLFIRADMSVVQTLCGKMGRLEGTLDSTGAGSRFTIGGVIIVNDTLCCLTTGHVLIDDPDTSETANSDDEDEMVEEEGRQDLAGDAPPIPSSTFSDPENQESDEAGVARSIVSRETRIGRLLTTSNWKRGVLSSNEDWSLIRLDAVSSSDPWLLNQFHHPGTELQDPLTVTIDRLARTEDEITEAEVIILAGYTGLQKGWLKTTAVQLYLDNATFEAREIVTHEPLRMGDSGSWVVQGSMLLGHVFAIQDRTPWCYMIPIAHVVEDIRKTLLTLEIQLPILAAQAGVPLLCPKAGRSHASLVAFGCNFCPSCKQDLSALEHSQGKDTSPKDSNAEIEPLLREDARSTSSRQSYVPSVHSDHIIEASTVPTSNIYEATQHRQTFDDDAYPSKPWTRKSEEMPPLKLLPMLDEIDPPNIRLERLLETDTNILLEFDNSINYNVQTTTLTLITPSSNMALRHVVSWDPSVDLTNRQIVIWEPYAVLVHHLPQLNSYASELRMMYTAGRSKTQRSEKQKHSTSDELQNIPVYEDVQALIDFTHRFANAAELATERSRFDRNACTFRNLWLLFYPGITVYANGDDFRGLAAYIVSSVVTDPSILRPSYHVVKPYIIHMWRLHYDGRYVSRQTFSVAIDDFDGEREITALKVFPCKYLDRVDGGKTRRRLEQQGRGWYQLLRRGAAYYSGKLPAASEEISYFSTFSLGTSLNIRGQPNHLQYYEGQVVVDRGGIRPGRFHDEELLPFNYEPDIDIGLSRSRNPDHLERMTQRTPGFLGPDYGPLDPEKFKDLELPDDQAEGTGHRYLICAPCLPGVLVNQKRWAWLDVNYCSPLKTDPRALDRLLLPQSTKDIVRTLVQDFVQSPVGDLQDPQRRQRSGRVTILLHGSSGTGKRYTAECLAAAEGKTLLTIHPGEIGIKPGRAKHFLSLWLRTAQILDAIVLVPAADAYVQQAPLAAGATNDVNSVFWACLESYSGIAILTTSRVGMFDDVTLSRITLPIFYEQLNTEARYKIGSRLMRNLDEENEFLKIGHGATKLWESLLQENVDWNGHDIKRVLENALAMARNRHRISREQSRDNIEGSDDGSGSLVLTEEDLRDITQFKWAFETRVKETLHSDVVPGRQRGEEFRDD